MSSTPSSPAAAPLSVAQEALWFASVSAPHQIVYNEAVSLRKRGAFDVDAFRAAFNELVRRHEAWRTTFDTIGGAAAQVAAAAPAIELPLLDLAGLTREEAERRAVQLVAGIASVPYDLRRGPLVRPRLIRFPDREHRVYLAMHHLVFDGVSISRVVLPELVALYDAIRLGARSPLPEPRAGYHDFARWEQEWIGGPRAGRRLAHWRRRLHSLPPLRLPLDHPRPQTRRFGGGTLPVTVERELVERLREIGRSARASLFHVLASTWSMLLGRYSGQEQIVFGTIVDLRRLPEFERVVGYAVTPVVLGVELADDPTFEELLTRVRNEVLDAVDNALPFERLVRELHTGGDGSANPFYQTLLVLEPPAVSPDPDWCAQQMEVELSDAIGNAKVDLELQLDERPEGHLAGRLIFDRDLVERETAARIAAQWLHLLRLAAADPHTRISRFALLTPSDERRQLVEWNATAIERRPACVDELALAACARDPAAVAVSGDGRSLSYGALAASATALAGVLRERGIGPGDVVAVCVPASAELAFAALGVLLAGAAYLLLDPDVRRGEATSIASDAGAGLLLARAREAGRLHGGPIPLLALDGAGSQPRFAPERGAGDPRARCEVRRPPGGHVARAATHDEIALQATTLASDLGIGAADTVLWTAPAPFRLPAVDLWMPLIAGARVVVDTGDAAPEDAQLNRMLKRERVSFLHAAPEVWQQLLDRGMGSVRGLKALSGGGPLSRELADQILGRCRVLWNAYAAPADAGYCAIARVQGSRPITIGRPIAGRSAYVVDDHGRPVPVGVPGWLLVADSAGGPAAPALIGDPSGAGGAERTGDRARWLADGELELLERSGGR